MHSVVLMVTMPVNAEIEKRIREAGERAAAEADRRRVGEVQPTTPVHENNGPKGPEPTRYGDWERKGIVSDF